MALDVPSDRVLFLLLVLESRVDVSLLEAEAADGHLTFGWLARLFEAALSIP